MTVEAVERSLVRPELRYILEIGSIEYSEHASNLADVEVLVTFWESEYFAIEQLAMGYRLSFYNRKAGETFTYTANTIKALQFLLVSIDKQLGV